MTKEEWTAHVAHVRGANPGLEYRKLMRLASKTYRNQSYLSDNPAVNLVGKALALGAGAIATKKAVNAATNRVKRTTGNLASKMIGSAIGNPKLRCPNAQCDFHKEPGQTKAAFVMTSAYEFSSYNIIFCKKCRVILGTIPA